MITRKSLEADTAVDTLTGEYRELYESSICFIRSISKMREHLYSYIASNSNTEIQKFESVKESINGLGGINDFWNAILNIRLNSVPLLDPVFAVKESIIACDKTIAQIETALSKWDAEYVITCQQKLWGRTDNAYFAIATDADWFLYHNSTG